MPGRGNPRESATEKRLPRCCGFACDVIRGDGETVGEEPTADRATGTARQAPPGAMPNRGLARAGPGSRSGIPPQGHFSPEARVGSLTPLVTVRAEEWSSMGETSGQNPAYRPSAQFQSNGATPLKGGCMPFLKAAQPKGLCWSLRGGYLSQNEMGRFHFGLNIPARRANGPQGLRLARLRAPPD